MMDYSTEIIIKMQMLLTATQITAITIHLRVLASWTKKSMGISCQL